MRDFIYRNYDVDSIIRENEVVEALKKNYHEYGDHGTDELLKVTRIVIQGLLNSSILELEEETDGKAYRILKIPTRYQCTACGQISYLGDNETVRCFSCESTDLWERNVR